MSDTSRNTGTFFSRTFWHGGAAGRQVGDFLIPGTEVPGYRNYLQRMSKEMLAEYRPDFVYITTEKDLAFDYAVYFSQLGPAALYKVVPERVEHDPDYPSGVSFRCSRAQVISIEEHEFSPGTPLTGASLRHQTWSDGSQLYSDDGFPLPNRAQARLGVLPEDLRGLGYNATFTDISRRITKVVEERNPGITRDAIMKVMREVGDPSVSN